MIAARRSLRWAFLSGLAGLVAACGSVDAVEKEPLNAVARAELERRYSEASSEKERRLLGIQLVEVEITDADQRTAASRARLKESLAKEQVVALQLAERLNRVQVIEQDLAAAQKRLANAEAERAQLEAQEKRLAEVRARKGTVTGELTNLSGELAREEARLAEARARTEGQTKQIEAELTRLARAGEIALAALAATQELTSRPTATRPTESAPAAQSRPASATK